MAEGPRKTLVGRILTWYAVTVVILLVVFGLLLNSVLKAQLMDDLTESLESQALLLRAIVGPERDLGGAVSDWARAESLRVTVIDSSGTVLADSSRDPLGMENHADRPEVRAALSGTTGISSRISASVGVEYRYVAVPPGAGGWIVRVAEPVSVIEERLRALRVVIALVGAGAALFGLGVVWLVARRIVRPIQQVTESVTRMASGDRVKGLGVPGTVELHGLAGAVDRMAEELHERARLSEAERRSREGILNVLDEGVILISTGNEVAFANTWARSTLGSRSGLAELPGPLQELAGSARSASGPVHREFVFGVPGRRIAATAVLPDAEGSVLLVLQDVTDAARVEAMRRDFVADASHELKTPIAAIRAGSETIARAIDEDPAAARAFAEQVNANAIRLGRIVVDLLDLSRLESEELVFELVRLDEIVVDEVARLDDAVDDVPVEFSLDVVAVTVAGSGPDLRLAVRNLLDNARRYAAGGRVVVVVRPLGGEGVLEVADDGVGIPIRDLPRIFERFYRVDVARSRHTGGTGLGLAIVKHVAERHGGRVEVESELGSGSTFRLVIPLAARSSKPE